MIFIHLRFASTTCMYFLHILSHHCTAYKIININVTNEKFHLCKCVTVPVYVDYV